MTVTIGSCTLILVGIGLTHCAPQIVVGEDRCGAARPAGSGVLELENADPFWYPVDAGAQGATIDDHKLLVDRDVLTYFGLGVKLECLDLTSYDGLSFRAVGSLGTTRVAEFQVQAQTYTNYPSKADDRAGGCTLDGAAKAWACCTNNAFVAEGVGPTAETYSIPWSAFTGGIPEPTLDPSELLGIQFQFNCREVPETPCDVAVTIDRVHFYRGKPRLGPRDDVSTATPARMNGCELTDAADLPGDHVSSDDITGSDAGDAG